MSEILENPDDDYYTENSDDDTTEGIKTNTISTEYSSSTSTLSPAKRVASIEIIQMQSQYVYMKELEETTQTLTVHTGNIDLDSPWKTIRTNAQTTISDIIEQSLERFDLEKCTLSNYYMVAYDSEEQAVYQLDEYDILTEVIESICEGTYIMPGSNIVRNSIYLHLSNQLDYFTNPPQLTDNVNRNTSLSFYINRKLRTIRKDEATILNFPIQMTTVKETGERSSITSIAKVKPTMMVVDFLKLALTEFDMEIETYTEFRVFLSISDIERPLPFECTLMTVFRVILNYDASQDREDIKFVIRRNHLPSINPFSLNSEKNPLCTSPISDESPTSTVVDCDSDEENPAISIHHMSIRLSIFENNQASVHEKLEVEEIPKSLEPVKKSEEYSLTKLENSSEDIHSQISESIDTLENGSLSDITTVKELVNQPALDVASPIKAGFSTTVSLGYQNLEGRRLSSTEIKTREIVSSILRKIAPPPSCPPPRHLIAQRKNVVEIARGSLVEPVIVEHGNSVVNTQLIKIEDLDAPLNDSHDHQFKDNRNFLNDSDSKIVPANCVKSEIDSVPCEQTQNIIEEDLVIEVEKQSSYLGKGVISNRLSSDAEDLIEKEISGESEEPDLEDSPIACVGEYVDTARGQPVRYIVRNEIPRASSDMLMGITRRMVTATDNSLFEAGILISSPENEKSPETMVDHNGHLSKLRPFSDTLHLASYDIEADGSVETSPTAWTAHQPSSPPPVYNIHETSDSAAALYRDNDEMTALITLVRGAAHFDYDHNEVNSCSGQGNEYEQDIRELFTSTEEDLREIEKELDQVMASIVDVF
ncbi:protein phosphatase regulator, variant 2 [Basidiobolus ranarum]